MADGATYDIDQAHRFLRMLDPTTEEFCFQLFRKTKEKDLQKPPVLAKLRDFESSAATHQTRGFNVTAVISETDGAHKNLEGVTRLRAAFIDFDAKLIGKNVEYAIGDKEPVQLDIEKLKQSRLPPRMIVETRPGNYHAYWPLNCNPIGPNEADRDAAREAFAELQTHLAYCYGSDPSVLGINWCMAIPGYWRFKEDEGKEPSLLKIVWESESEVRYDPQVLLKAVKDANAKDSTKSKAKKQEDEDADDEDDDDDDEATQPEGNAFSSDEGRAVATQWLRKVCSDLANMYEGGRDTLLNQICWTAGGYIAGGALDEQTAKADIQEAADKSGLDKSRINDKLTRVIEQGKAKPIIVDPNVITLTKWGDTRDKFLKSNFKWLYKGEEWCTLVYWMQSFWYFESGAYRRIETDTLSATAASWLSKCKTRFKIKGKTLTKPFQPNTSHWSELVSQCKAKVHYPAPSEPSGLKNNTWMPGARDQVDMLYSVPMLDGIYDVLQEKHRPLNPGLFVTNAIQVGYHELREEGMDTWTYFLNSVFTKEDETLDQESIDLLQEWFGYCLTADTSRHKFLTLVGPPRSGKGTIGHLLTHILGETAVGSFDFSLITDTFGLEDLVHKTLAISPDVRDMTSEINRVLDVFLRMTSGDVMNVQRKNKSKVDVKFPAKIMMMTNEVPEFKDTSGAIMSRLLLIQMHQSFVGREDLKLLDRLKNEAPSITRWAIEGLKRLIKNGSFTMPQSAIETRNEIIESSTPLVTFANDCLDFDPDFCCNKDWLYAEYHEWATQNGFRAPMHKLKFYRQFKGVFGDKYHNRTASADAENRVQYIKGIGIRRDPDKGSYTSVKPPHENRGKQVVNNRVYDERNPPPHTDVPF